MVDDRVNGDGGLPRLTVADDQLALATTDRDHAVDGLDAGLQRLFHRLAFDHAGGDAFQREVIAGFNRALAVNGTTEGINDTSDKRLTYWNGNNPPCAPDFVTFLQVGVVAQQDGANLIFFEVHGDAGHVSGKLKHLASHDLLEAVQTGDAVTE